jgi:hypothetical protein
MRRRPGMDHMLVMWRSRLREMGLTEEEIEDESFVGARVFITTRHEKK